MLLDWRFFLPMPDGSGARAMRRLPLFRGIRPIQRSRIPKDVLAGLTLAAMNIPQALGYARIAGMPVITGLYTLLLPPVAFATFGSSRYLVVASDSATAAILASGLAALAPIASPRYVALAGLAALLTGASLMLARLLKLGFLAEFLSQTVLAGFLTGVGLQVGIAVVGGMLGVEVHSRGTVGQLTEVIGGLSQVHLPTLGISLATLMCILGVHYFVPKVPGPLIAVVAAIAASRALDFAGHGISVIGPVLGGLPALGVKDFSWQDAGAVIPVAGSCFVMIVAQSAATARAYALRHHQQLDENADFAGLAAANLAAGMSGTFVVNGSPTQTAMVERSGGQSQMAHLATAVVVSLVLLLLTAPLKFLPQCVLESVVFTIAIRLIDVRGLRGIRQESPGEYTLAVTTALVVVLLGVEPGILLAMALSLLRIVHHSYHPHTAVLAIGERGEWLLTPAVPGAMTEAGLLVYRFGASLFYYNATRFSMEVLDLVRSAPSPVHCVVVDAGPIANVDYTASRAVRQLKEDLDRRGVVLAFAHVQSDLRADLDRHHLTEIIGAQRLFDTLRDALARVRSNGV
jgi:SulP family sulfate permease